MSVQYPDVREWKGVHWLARIAGSMPPSIIVLIPNDQRRRGAVMACGGYRTQCTAAPIAACPAQVSYK